MSDTNDTSYRQNNEAEYLAGYSKCLAEISSFLEQTRTGEATLKKDIVNHVTEKIKGQLSSIKLQPSEDQPESTDIKSPDTRLIPIIPSEAKTGSTNGVQSCDLPVDLSKKVTEHCESSEKPESDKVPPSDLSQQTNSICQPYPFGVLCGGQVMLLVQIPQTMTSQQTPAVAHQQPNLPSISYKNSHNNSGLPNFLTSYSSVNSLPTHQANSTEHQQQLIASAPLSTHAQDGVTPIPSGFQLLNLVMPSQNEDNNNNSKDDHWRPW